MSLPTEPIGSIPRPPYFDEAPQRAVQETIQRLEETGSPVLVDGEQTKPDSFTYPLNGLTTLAPDGVVIPFADGHTRQLPRLTSGPFRYKVRAEAHLREAMRHTDRPVKQTVVAPSALTLLYPTDGIDGYSRDTFLSDLADEAEADIRGCLDAGASCVQLDFSLGRLALKLDPSREVLKGFVALDNEVLGRFSTDERSRIGVHTCPGADQASAHSLDTDYTELLPELFRLHAGAFYVQMASESEPNRALRVVRDHLPSEARVFVGVIDPLDPRVETAEEVRDRVLAAAAHIPVEQLGTCDDAGFAAWADDRSTSREIAFAKIEARVRGTRLAAEHLGL